MMIERDPLRKQAGSMFGRVLLGESVPTCEEEKDATGLLQAARSVMYVCSHVEIELWRRARAHGMTIGRRRTNQARWARNGIFGLLST